MKELMSAYLLGHLASHASKQSDEDEYTFYLPWIRNSEVERLMSIGFDTAIYNKNNVEFKVKGVKSIAIPKGEEWEFLRGVYEASGIYNTDDEEVAAFAVQTPEIAKQVSDFLHEKACIRHTVSSDVETGASFYTFFGTDAFDLLSQVYKKSEDSHRSPFIFNLFHNWIKKSPRHANAFMPIMEVYRTDVNAVTPTKARESDVGYDLTIIKLHKVVNSVTALYDTGIKVKPPQGYYVEVVPRSSLSKSGYMLSNSVGIIDRSYTGTLLVSLTKVDPDASPITFPFKCCQMVLRQQEYVNIKESTEDFADTSRGSGGFGSTSSK